MLPSVYIQSEYLRNIIKKRIRSDLILKYNNKPNERIVLIFVMIKIFKILIYLFMNIKET